MEQRGSGLTFTGDRKDMDHYLLPGERVVLAYLIPKVPRWLQTTHLTLMTVLWSLGVLWCGYMAGADRVWLWGFSACIVLQYLSDMLDGAVGRARGTGLIKWGFYMDHFLDYFFMASIVAGYGFLLPESYGPWVLACLALTGGFMVHSFLDFGVTGKFKISVGRFGVSEMRCVLVAFNMLLMVSGTKLLAGVFPYVVFGMGAALAVLIYTSQKEFGEADMDHKRKAGRWESKRRPGMGAAWITVAAAALALTGVPERAAVAAAGTPGEGCGVYHYVKGGDIC